MDENALVDTIEAYFTEKILKTQEIKNLYEKQMQEIREMGNNIIILQILKKMEDNMQSEIEDLNRKIEHDKNHTIFKITNEQA